MARYTKKDEVIALVQALRGPLRLQDWVIDIQFVQVPKEKAGCTAKPEYKEATLFFDLRKIPGSEIRAFVLHEMLHIHVWKLAAVGERFATNAKDLEAVNWEEEALTTELERLLLPLVMPIMKDVKQAAV